MHRQYSSHDRVRRAQFIPGMDTAPELEWMLGAFAFSTRHVEVGSFCGKSLYASTGNMRRGEIYALDTMKLGGVLEPSDGWVKKVLLHTIDAITSENAQLSVTFINADSKVGAAQITGKVDSVYIDANHRYESVINDINIWLPRVGEGGVIAGHDYCDEFPGVKRAVHEVFQKQFTHVQGTRIWWHERRRAAKDCDGVLRQGRFR